MLYKITIKSLFPFKLEVLTLTQFNGTDYGFWWYICGLTVNCHLSTLQDDYIFVLNLILFFLFCC